MNDKSKIFILFAIFVFFIISTALLLSIANGGVVGGNKIAVIPIKGEIVEEECGGSIIFGYSRCASVKEIEQMLESADDDPQVKAILLDIDSPGGSAFASKMLMKKVKNVTKPVVALIGNSGASGAYYVASAADKIVADEQSITCSIGVLMEVTNYEKLYEELGINVTVFKGGKFKDIGSPYRDMTDEERETFQKIVDDMFTRFKQDIADNRNMTIEEVDLIADGTPCLGSQAKDKRLVDTLGGIDDAIDIASELGGIQGKPRIEDMSKETQTLF